MRKVSNGSVYTMLNGGCVEYGHSRMIKNSYSLKNILCYNNWIEGPTNDQVIHYIDPADNVNMCTLIYPLCSISDVSD